MKYLRKFNENSGEGYYIIGWGLSGGFGGINNYEVIKADSIEWADKEAYHRAVDEFESYSGSGGLRTIEEIMEEDELDYDSAEETYNEEREGWLEYVSYPYSKELENKFKDYHYENRYKNDMEL
jgi:hypothetical protein